MANQADVFRYEQLSTRSIKAQEDTLLVSKSLLEVSKNLQGNIKELNDKFVFHTQDTAQIRNDVSEIRESFMKWIKVLLVLLFVIVGGTSMLKLLLETDWAQVLQIL